MTLKSFFTDNKRTLLMLLAMSTGCILYSPLARVDAALEGKISPVLIFAMLFVTFCKVSVRDIKLSPIHLFLVLFQLVAAPAAYYIFSPLGEVVAQGAMICFIAPVAMAAVAVAAMLGANIITMASFTLVCNVVMSLAIPLFLDLFGNGECTFAEIFARVLPLLVYPILVAQILRVVAPKVAAWIGERSYISFYMWLILMTFVLARTTNFVVLQIDSISTFTFAALALVALFACLVQYGLGRVLGNMFGDGVAGAQSLGQKNTVLAVWLAQSFLNPIASIAPTAYIIWQNIVNSYQIYRFDRRKRASK